MEFWFLGPRISMLHALILLGLALGISIVFVATIGFRENEPPGWGEILTETVDAIGISIVVTAVTLTVLGKLDLSTPGDIALGRIAIELLPVALGVAIANHILPRQKDCQGQEEDRQAGKAARVSATTRDIVASAGGALLLSLNIAPTDEVALLAAELLSMRWLKTSIGRLRAINAQAQPQTGWQVLSGRPGQDELVIDAMACRAAGYSGIETGIHDPHVMLIAVVSDDERC